MIIPWIHSTPDLTSNNFFHIFVSYITVVLNTNYLELKKF